MNICQEKAIVSKICCCSFFHLKENNFSFFPASFVLFVLYTTNPDRFSVIFFSRTSQMVKKNVMYPLCDAHAPWTAHGECEGSVHHILEQQHVVRWHCQSHARPPLAPKVPRNTNDTLAFSLIVGWVHFRAPGMGALKRSLQNPGRDLNPGHPIRSQTRYRLSHGDSLY